MQLPDVSGKNGFLTTDMLRKSFAAIVGFYSKSLTGLPVAIRRAGGGSAALRVALGG